MLIQKSIIKTQNLQKQEPLSSTVFQTSLNNNKISHKKK